MGKLGKGARKAYYAVGAALLIFAIISITFSLINVPENPFYYVLLLVAMIFLTISLGLIFSAWEASPSKWETEEIADDKERDVAKLLAFFPGAGYWYLGESKRGLPFTIQYIANLAALMFAIWHFRYDESVLFVLVSCIFGVMVAMAYSDRDIRDVCNRCGLKDRNGVGYVPVAGMYDIGRAVAASLLMPAIFFIMPLFGTSMGSLTVIILALLFTLAVLCLAYTLRLEKKRYDPNGTPFQRI